jgi:TonB family protein
MLSLNDLQSPAVALDWHEAVAVAAALAGLMVDAQADACPAPGSVTLLPTGDLRISGPEIVAGPPAAGAAIVLRQLLDLAPCPAELHQLAETFAADARVGPDGQDALVSFLASVAFFERPGRQTVLTDVAIRAEPALERARRAAALDALTERTRIAAGGDARPVSAPPDPEPHPEPPDPPTPGAAWDSLADNSWRRLALPAAVSLAVFLGMAYLAAAWFSPPDPGTTRSAREVEDDLPISGPEAAQPSASPASAGKPGEAAPRTPPASAPARVEPLRPAAGPANATPAPGALAGRSTPATAPAAPTTRSADVVVAERDGRVVPSPIAPVRTSPRAAPVAAGRVFTAGDPQVTPAILIRPHLPEQPPPDVPEEQIGTLEFVITESGSVEHVHLTSPANRYQERMLVAAAKTWQFQPATRDGRPVRFRIRIRVTL